MELMYIDPDLFTTWTRESKDSYYVYPNEFNCQERKDVNLEWIEYASQIDSLDTFVFSWSNVTDDMLEPLFSCDHFVCIYLDGLDLKFETLERFVRMEHVYSIIITDTNYDQDRLLQLKIEFPDKEIAD